MIKIVNGKKVPLTQEEISDKAEREKKNRRNKSTFSRVTSLVVTDELIAEVNTLPDNATTTFLKNLLDVE